MGTKLYWSVDVNNKLKMFPSINEYIQKACTTLYLKKESELTEKKKL